MKRHEIERKLNQTILNIVPDSLDNILARCEEREGFENMNLVKKKEDKKELIEKKKTNFWIPKLAGALATFAICLFGIFGFAQYQDTNKSVDSIIDFDVNPSIEIKTNKKEEIIEVNALNDEGKIILEGMDLEKVDLDVGVNAIIGSMLKNGYITEAQNSILVSVKNNDEAKAKELEERISKEIDALLGAKNIEGSVLSQMYNDDDEIEKLAKENNISEGKANLISKVLKSEMKDSKGNLYTFESLAKLSINELNLLLNSKNVVLSEVSSIGTANEKSYIGTEKAKEIAFSKAGVTANDVYDLEIELDCDDGILIYEVEFKSGKNEYEYDINAKDGSIIKSSVDINDDDDDDDDKINANVNTGSNTNNSNTNNNNRYDDDDDRYDDDRYDDDGYDDDDDRYDDDDDDRYDDDDDDDDDRYDDDDDDRYDDDDDDDD